MAAFGGTAYAQDDNQANAQQLLEKAQQSLAVVVAAAQKDQSMNLEVAKSKPFWDGLKDLNTNLDNSKRDLENKDNRFFASLSSAMAGYAQAEIALIMNGSENPGVANGMKTLGGILQTLNENFSKEAARLKQGGELSTSEKQQLDKLIAQQDELLKKLEAVEQNVAKNNAEMKAAIAKMKEESKKIRRSGRGVGGFVGGFFTAHILYDWMWGWHWWWGPWGGWCPGFIDINIVIWDGWADDFDYDWELAEDLVDLDDLDFELDGIDAMGVDVDANLNFLDEGDFSFDGDMGALTEDIDHGWDDVTTDTGAEVMESYESNFDNSAIYDRQEPVETFQDHGVEDFGNDMGSMDFGGGFDDW
jgi:hypothetical protein